MPLDLDLVRDDAVGDLRGLGAAARREDERERAVVADLLDDLERLLEVLLGLAGEADDDVRRQRAVGNVLADQGDAVEVALAVVGAPHRLQDPARARLQREVDVLAHARRARRGRGSRPRACPSGAGSCSGSGRSRRSRRCRRSSSANARRSAAAPGQVAAVGVDVLPEQRHLPHAVGGHRLRPRRRARRIGRLTSRPRVEGTMQ